MKIVILKNSTLVQKSISVIILLALVISGTGTGFLQYLQDDNKFLIKEVYSEYSVFDISDLSDDSPNRMSTDGIPPASNYAYIVPLVNFQTSNGYNKYQYLKSTALKIDSRIGHSFEKSTAQTSSSLVSAKIGKMFTLVGAKPSGTS